MRTLSTRGNRRRPRRPRHEIAEVSTVAQRAPMGICPEVQFAVAVNGPTRLAATVALTPFDLVDAHGESVPHNTEDVFSCP
jgi:hypothetical protein